MQRLPHLLPEDLLSQKHVLQRVDSSRQTIYSPRAQTGLQFFVVVDTCGIESNALRTGLLATAARLFAPTRLACWDLVVGLVVSLLGLGLLASGAHSGSIGKW